MFRGFEGILVGLSVFKVKKSSLLGTTALGVNWKKNKFFSTLLHMILFLISART